MNIETDSSVFYFLIDLNFDPFIDLKGWHHLVILIKYDFSLNVSTVNFQLFGCCTGFKKV